MGKKRTEIARLRAELEKATKDRDEAIEEAASELSAAMRRISDLESDNERLLSSLSEERKRADELQAQLACADEMASEWSSVAKKLGADLVEAARVSMRRAGETCKWTADVGYTGYNAACGYFCEWPHTIGKYCPACGREIKIRDEKKGDD